MHRPVRTWHLRMARGFFSRPLLPFLVQLGVLAPLILAPEPRRVAAGYLFFLPWLLPVFALLSLPFVFAAFRAFRLDVATRRNHALEHATILELEARSGRRLAGRSSRTGFRVSGHVSIDQVRRAFNRVSRTLRAGEPLVYISPRCGSNIVTAIGAGVVLLLALVAWSVAFQPSWTLRAAVPGGGRRALRGTPACARQRHPAPVLHGRRLRRRVAARSATRPARGLRPRPGRLRGDHHQAAIEFRPRWR